MLRFVFDVDELNEGHPAFCQIDGYQDLILQKCKSQTIDCQARLGFTFNKDLVRNPKVSINGAEADELEMFGDYDSTQQIANTFVEALNKLGKGVWSLDQDTLLRRDRLVLTCSQQCSLKCDEIQFARQVGLNAGVAIQLEANDQTETPNKLSYLGFQAFQVLCDQISAATVYDRRNGNRSVMLNAPAGFGTGQFTTFQDGSQSFQMSKSQIQTGFTLQFVDDRFRKGIPFFESGTELIFDLLISENAEELTQIQNATQYVQQQTDAKNQQAQQAADAAQQEEQAKRDKAIQLEQLALLRKIAFGTSLSKTERVNMGKIQNEIEKELQPPAPQQEMPNAPQLDEPQ